MTLTTIPATLGIFALAFLLLLLVKVVKQPAEDKVAKQLLTLLLAGLLSMAFCFFYIYADMFQYWPRVAFVEIGFVYWIGPSLYFYIRRLNGGHGPFRNPLILLHWLPALVIEAVLLPFFLMPLAEKTQVMATRSGPWPLAISWIWLGFHVHLVIYILCCQPQLQTYRQRLLNNFSDVSALNLRWLQLLCYGLVVQILAERLLPILKITSSGLSDTAAMTVYMLVIALAYSALGQSRLQFALDGPTPPANGIGKYQRSGLRDDSAQYYLDRLARLMETERCYLQGDLSLQTLAEQLKLSPHHLSQLLNDKLRKNFYDYINEQRVEYAKHLLLQERQRAITDIAFDAGYNSKNSFYNAFKRHAGMSPSEFRARHARP